VTPKPIKTAILAGAVLFFALPHGSDIALLGSFVLVAAAVIFVPWAIYSMVRMVIRPSERRDRGTSLAILAITLVVSFTAQAHRDTAARKEATAAVSAIQAHKSRTGSYPETLNSLGIDAQALKQKFSLTYRLNDGKATLFYSQPSMPMVAHHYKFESNSWGKLD
jgi:hypothetical protein